MTLIVTSLYNDYALPEVKNAFANILMEKQDDISKVVQMIYDAELILISKTNRYSFKTFPYRAFVTLASFFSAGESDFSSHARTVHTMAPQPFPPSVIIQPFIHLLSL